MKKAPSPPRHHRRRSRRQIPSSSLTSPNPPPTPQGAAAAGTFSSKGILAGAYADGSETHKTTEEVEAYWMGVIEKEREESGSKRAPGDLPWGFEQRAKVREAEAKAYGAADAAGPGRSAYGGPTPGTVAGTGTGTGPSPSLAAAFGGDRHAPPPEMGTEPSPGISPETSAVPGTMSAGSPSAEVALLRVATHGLEALAATLRAKPVALDDDERAKFASAVKKAMEAVLHCRA